MFTQIVPTTEENPDLEDQEDYEDDAQDPTPAYNKSKKLLKKPKAPKPQDPRSNQRHLKNQSPNPLTSGESSQLQSQSKQKRSVQNRTNYMKSRHMSEDRIQKISAQNHSNPDLRDISNTPPRNHLQ